MFQHGPLDFGNLTEISLISVQKRVETTVSSVLSPWPHHQRYRLPEYRRLVSAHGVHSARNRGEVPDFKGLVGRQKQMTSVKYFWR